MRIALLAVPGSMKSALSGLSDMFWLANQVAEQNPALRHRDVGNEPGFSAQIVTADGQPVIDAQGRQIESEGSFESDKYALIIASGMRLDKEKYPLSKAAITDAARWVKAQHQQGCAVAGACAGGFVLAEAGLLNGRMCATTWWLFHTFRERYPLAKPVWGRALVEDHNIITTGGRFHGWIWRYTLSGCTRVMRWQN
jgi:transcriptional regulator GlxA family with amidase domain